MGAYMSKPITVKESENGSGNGLIYGGSSMQGWRVSQEDAHNCVAELDEGSSFFGVYDGHGGAEVAIYLSRHFPEFLKTTDAYKKGEIGEALKESFLKMDEKVKQEEAMEEIKAIVKEVNGEKTEGESSADYEDENVGELYEEATMPLDKLVEKYQGKGAAVDGKSDTAGASSSSTCSSEGPCSSRKIAFVSASSSSSNSKGEMAGGSGSSKRNASSSSSDSAKNVSDEKVAETVLPTSTKAGSCDDDEIKIEINGGTQEVNSDEPKEELKKSLVPSTPEEVKDEVTTTNGSASKSIQAASSSVNGDKNKEESTEHILSNGDQADGIRKQDGVKDETDTSEVATPPPKPRKGKVHPTTVLISQTEEPKSKRRSPRKSGLASLAFGNDSDDSELDSSDSDHPDPAGDSDEDSDDADGGDGTSSEEDDDEDEEDSDEEEDDEFLSGIQEPVYDSGTTAVVAFLRRKDDKINLWVANAGDSRCVLSRKSEAIEMSHDHKPESEEETLRIVNAGGKITDDGRVNGGLNLSRAIGDHSYKGNVNLPPEEQMISPMPTIQHIEIDPKLDDFLVLACDGVWNSLSSQEVVDFVAERIATAPSLSSICEELFEACLAPNTHGDGTGCDNMTAIIVQLRKEVSPGVKRSLEREDSAEESTQVNKKCKLAE